MRGFWAILLKEFAHIRRDRVTVFFTFMVPVIQLTIFGFAIDVTIENIPLAVLDLSLWHALESELLAGLCARAASFVITTAHGDERSREELTRVLPPDQVPVRHERTLRSDLDLLQAVGDPVAVMPDPPLLETARGNRWHIIRSRNVPHVLPQ